MLEYPETGAFTLNFEALGYENSLFLLNMGSLILVYLLFPMISVTLFLMKFSNNSTIRSTATDAINRIFFNSILRFFEETYLVTSVCCFINLSYIKSTQ